MSRMRRITPWRSKKAMERGIRVFFIQKPPAVGAGKRKTMPSSSGKALRNMRPWAWRSGVSATSTLRKWRFPPCST